MRGGDGGLVGVMSCGSGRSGAAGWDDGDGRASERADIFLRLVYSFLVLPRRMQLNMAVDPKSQLTRQQSRTIPPATNR